MSRMHITHRAHTGPALPPKDCGCDVLPWQDCEHSAWDRGLSLTQVIERSQADLDLVPADARQRPQEPADARSQALAVAMAFHEAYERLAPLNGYETRKETRHFDPNTANGRTMLAVCTELLYEGKIDVGMFL